MSRNEAQEAVVLVADKMFGQNLKLHFDNEFVDNLDT